MRKRDASLPAIGWLPWSAHSRAEVSYLLGEQRNVERIARRVFGRPLAPSEYANLVGAPDTATVEVGASDGHLYLEMRDAVSSVRGYFYLHRTKTTAVLRIDGLRIDLRVLRGHGVGLQIFHRQARGAARLGVGRIEAVAGRTADENGYYTWPRYGFEGWLPASHRPLPPGLERARTLSDVMSCKVGRDWWKRCGVTVPVRFDLAAGSPSRQSLARYVRERTETGRSEEATRDVHRSDRRDTTPSAGARASALPSLS